MNRTEHIHRELQKIDFNLKAVFIPRTLYELTFFKDLIEKAPPGCQKKHLPKFRNQGDNNNEKIKEIAFNVNGIFERLFTNRMEMSGSKTLTGKYFFELLEDKISFLADTIKTEEYTDKIPDSKIGYNFYSE